MSVAVSLAGRLPTPNEYPSPRRSELHPSKLTEIPCQREANLAAKVAGCFLFCIGAIFSLIASAAIVVGCFYPPVMAGGVSIFPLGISAMLAGTHLLNTNSVSTPQITGFKLGFMDFKV